MLYFYFVHFVLLKSENVFYHICLVQFVHSVNIYLLTNAEKSELGIWYGILKVILESCKFNNAIQLKFYSSTEVGETWGFQEIYNL